MSPPAEVQRLLPEMTLEEIERAEHLPFLVGRVLEEGDREDLRWLCRRVDESMLRDWLTERAERQLSRRSRLFWSLLLSSSAGRDGDNALWPL